MIVKPNNILSGTIVRQNNKMRFKSTREPDLLE